MPLFHSKKNLKQLERYGLFIELEYAKDRYKSKSSEWQKSVSEKYKRLKAIGDLGDKATLLEEVENEIEKIKSENKTKSTSKINSFFTKKQYFKAPLLDQNANEILEIPLDEINLNATTPSVVPCPDVRTFSQTKSSTLQSVITREIPNELKAAFKKTREKFGAKYDEYIGLFRNESKRRNSKKFDENKIIIDNAIDIIVEPVTSFSTTESTTLALTQLNAAKYVIANRLKSIKYRRENGVPTLRITAPKFFTVEMALDQLHFDFLKSKKTSETTKKPPKISNDQKYHCQECIEFLDAKGSIIGKQSIDYYSAFRQAVLGGGRQLEILPKKRLNPFGNRKFRVFFFAKFSRFSSNTNK